MNPIRTLVITLALALSAVGQVYSPMPVPQMQFLDNSGNPLSGGKLYSYVAGTTTPQNTYTDSTGGTPNANPVILDSAGRANIWLSSASYKLVLQTSAGVTIWTVDNVSGQTFNASSTCAANYIQAGPTSGSPAVPTCRAMVAGDLPTAIDFSAKTTTKPTKVGSANPGTCSQGEMFFNTSSAAGSNLYLCTSANTWTLAVPTTTVRTDQSNTFTTGTQDLSGSAHTLPAKKGTTASLPGTCTAGEEYFATDATAGNNKYLCTAANTWTQQFGAAAQTASTRGTYASVPACSSSSNGSLYWTTDSGLVGQCNGTSWQWRYGQIVASPTTSGGASTWFNQTAATITDIVGGTILTGTAGAGSNIQARIRGVPATPYTYSVCMEILSGPASYAGGGVLWTDGTSAANKAITLGTHFDSTIGTAILEQKWTNATTFSASYTLSPATPLIPRTGVCYALVDNGTNRKVGVSYDGQNWFSLHSVGNTDFLTPGYIGYYVNTYTSSTIPAIKVFSETVTASALF